MEKRDCVKHSVCFTPSARTPERSDMTSLFFNRCDFDRSNEGFESVEVCVAFGQNANHSEFVFAKPFGQGFEPPAQNRHVGSGEGKREFLGRRIPVLSGVRVWFDGVVNQLAGVEAVIMFLVELELNAGAMLVHCFITTFHRDFFRAVLRTSKFE